ncbi:TlpA disulfide reductase family protein [Polaribacter sp. Q13]|uniref:TlpA family protein disulfide reductase n=1 Tax=Polaribacter sp. Q13 TaxID=2806551 RepID=UPI00193AF531|nr:TlpA disulfide reductase family protein [Polaribacter sp. Q13]QVY65012.1 TlpA family protein disulfide reductase [Polaribacter sp. Q13]
MKPYTHALLLFGIFIGVLSCKSKEEKQIDYAIISGKITNSSEKEITLNWRDTFKVNKNVKTVVKLSETGTFLDTLKLLPGHYSFNEGKNRIPLHIENGIKINISYDAKNFKNTIQFCGEGSGTSSYLMANEEEMGRVFNSDKATNFYNVKEPVFKAKIKAIKNDLETILAATKNIPNNIREKEKREINYHYLDYINRYKGVYQYVSGDSTYVPSKEFTKELDALTYDREDDFMFSSIYQYLLLGHFRDKASKIAQAQGTSQDLELLKSLAKIPNDNIKDIMLVFYGNSGLSRATDLEAMYKLLMDNYSTEAKKQELTKLYNELKMLSKGEASPVFTNYENHAGGTTSLTDFKGKYLYIDVWATWCGPCKYEIPFLEKIEKEYHGKNITFISLSVDKKNAYDAWKKMVKDDNMGGIQLLADNDFKSDFIEAYKINAIPKFILIDPQGNIVNANAPRPSSKEVRALLDNLL